MRSDRTPVPVGAEARGKLRVWKRQAQQRYERVIDVYNGKLFGQLGVDYREKRGIGQRRALIKLKRMLGEARFIEARLETPAYALWAVLCPRDPIFCPDPDIDPGRLQNCVAVNGLALGRLVRPDGTRHDGRSDCGLWALAATDHALHRLLQRDPVADVDAAMWGAHKAALDVTRLERGAAVFLPAGNGGFVATIEVSRDVDTGGTIMVHAHAHTWLHNDQLPDAQPPIAAVGDRLGDSVLLPLPLRV
jgi:hypothetical protein